MDVTQLISNLGFPIAACVYMAWYNTNIVRQMTEAVNNNSNLLSRILDKLNLEDINKGDI